MKREAHTHPKILEFIDWIDEQVGVQLRAAGVHAGTVGVGILERLWNLASEHAVRGDIGQFSNKRIASSVGWRKDADDLIEAMLRIGLLDEDDEYRLVIHNWATHCGEYVHARLARSNMVFCDGSEPSTRKLNSDERRRMRDAGRDVQRTPAPCSGTGGGTAGSTAGGTAGGTAGYRRPPLQGAPQGAARSQAKPSHSQAIAKPKKQTRGQARSVADPTEAVGDAAAAAAGSDPSGFTFVLADGSDLFDLPSSQVDAWRAEFPDVPVAEVLSRLADWTADNRPSMGRRRIIGWIAGKLAEEAKAPAPQPATNRGGRTRPAAEEHPWRPRMANGEDLTDEEIFEGVPQWMLDREKTKRKPEPTPTGVHANGKQPPLDPAEIGVGDDELPPL